VDERSRRLLFQQLEEVLGVEGARWPAPSRCSAGSPWGSSACSGPGVGSRLSHRPVPHLEDWNALS